MESISAWAWGEPVRSCFALPRGRWGRLAGWLMLWTNRQRGLRELLDIRAGERVLEIGYGPGGLIRVLTRTGAAQICGVDPSPQMRDLAVRRHRKHANGGRVDLRVGTAEHTGLPPASFDCVVSVSSVALWPDLSAGLRELHRVTRPGGRVVIAWHGGTRSWGIGRRLALPERQLDVLEGRLAQEFTTVARRELPTLTVFTAVNAEHKSPARREGHQRPIHEDTPADRGRT
ncbi:MAG: class I SAM-dependent methyltransferase [Nocardioidaceae bacterium]